MEVEIVTRGIAKKEHGHNHEGRREAQTEEGKKP
jgi:hypothetical protein